MAKLPTYFSLKSKYNNKYLLYTNGDENSNGLLKYSGTILVTPFSKFTIIPSSQSHEAGLVHIRSCYNNKLWVRLSENSNFIAAIADEEDNDATKWSCTLFKPIFMTDQNAYCFLHVQLNAFLRITESVGDPYTDCLEATVTDLASLDQNLVLSIAVDWDSIFILPKYTAFESDNGKYLKPLGDSYMQFSVPNVENIAITFEITSVIDAYVSVKHFDTNKYWNRKSDNWVKCESINVQEDDPNVLYWPLKVDSQFVGLRNKGNNNFCKRYTTGKFINCLTALTTNLNDSTARLKVTDVGIAKSIEDIEYKFKDARVYGKNILTLYEGIAINNTEFDSQVIVAFKYQKKVERTWSSSVSKIAGVKPGFAAKVPIIGKDGFSYVDSNVNYKWDVTEVENGFEEVKETIDVGAMSKVKYVGLITKASYDVPFSYTLRETLQDGRQVTNHYEDGLFTGFITFDYQFKTQNLPN